jgi:hypothetical protein
MKARCLPVGMGSKAAPLVGLPLSPGTSPFTGHNLHSDRLFS